MTAIHVENLRKQFGRGTRAVHALNGVTLSVEKGEIYGLLGQNGAGKTTMVKILLDLVRPTDGSASLLDRPAGSAATRREIGYLPEDHRFPDYRTGEGLLHYFGMLSHVPGELRRKRVPELLELAGLADAAKRKLRTYSKGMKQRVGIAQALIADPQVLFLDEPTDGVDPVGRAEIREMLVRLKGEGKTIFLNSHLLSETERVCDRVGILDRGRLIQEGTIAELTAAEKVYTIGTSAPVDEGTMAELRKRAGSVTVTVTGRYDLTLSKDEDLDGIVDLLRAKGIGVRMILQKRLSLEDAFLKAVQDS